MCSVGSSLTSVACDSGYIEMKRPTSSVGYVDMSCGRRHRSSGEYLTGARFRHIFIVSSKRTKSETDNVRVALPSQESSELSDALCWNDNNYNMHNRP